MMIFDVAVGNSMSSNVEKYSMIEKGDAKLKDILENGIRTPSIQPVNVGRC